MATYWSRCVQGWRRKPGTLRAGSALATVLLGFFLLGTASSNAQPINTGIAYLTGSQMPDGSWESPQVLPMTATTEALHALQVLTAGALNRSAAVTRLEAESIWDNDDLARRIQVLSAEGRDVTALVAQLRNDA